MRSAYVSKKNYRLDDKSSLYSPKRITKMRSKPVYPKNMDTIIQSLKDNMTKITYKTVECLGKSTQPHDQYVYDKLCQSLYTPVLIPNLSFTTEKQSEFIDSWLQYHDLGICSLDGFSILSEQNQQ